MKRRRRGRKKKSAKHIAEQKPRKFGGNICVQISIDEVREGDYIMYWDSGHRVGRVQKNHKGYKHRWVKLYASMWNGHVLRRSKKIKPKLIRSAWRKQATNQQEEGGTGS